MKRIQPRWVIVAALAAVLTAGCAVGVPVPAAPVPTSPMPDPSPSRSAVPAGPAPSRSAVPTSPPPSVPVTATAQPTVTPTPTPTGSSSAKPAKDTRTGAELDHPYLVNGIPVVSKKHPISKRYQPEDPAEHGLEQEVASALAEMTAAAKADGVKVKVYSAYRSYAEQDKLLKRKIVEYGNEKLARRYNAEPGKSEHQTGLAVDLWDGVTWGLGVRNTRTGKWLWKHSREYGFILRYPPDKERITGYAYEPWHFRYIGVEDSMKFKANSKVTLEEYLGLA